MAARARQQGHPQPRRPVGRAVAARLAAVAGDAAAVPGRLGLTWERRRHRAPPSVRRRSAGCSATCRRSSTCSPSGCSRPTSPASAPSRRCSSSTGPGSRRPDALAVLADLADGHFTTEVGAFNLELQPRPAGVRRHVPEPARGAARPAPRRRPGGRRGGRPQRRPGRDPADDPQGRPVDGQHGPEPALPRPQHGPDEPARRGLRAAHQGHRRAARPPGLGDGRGLQRQLPGAPAGRARRLRQPVQRRPTARRAGAGLRHQLADAVRQAAVGGDPDRPVRAGGRHAPARPRTCAIAAPASRSGTTG